LQPDEFALGYGRSRGVPLRVATLVHGSVGPPGDVEVWRLAGRMPLQDGPVDYDQRLTRYADGTLGLHAAEAALRVDLRAATLTVEAPSESWARQLVTTYGLPLLLERARALVIHACAVVAPGQDSADLVCATSGTGKSTLLVGLIAAGWAAVSEDVSVIDLRDPVPTVWPGPPWVRRNAGGPPGSTVRFETADKTAWDIEPWQVDRPLPIGRIAFMQPAAPPAVWRALDLAEAVARLVRSAIRLEAPAERAREVFARCATIAHAAPAAEFRVPVSADWVDVAEAALRKS
jgi:hypothetical protein